MGLARKVTARVAAGSLAVALMTLALGADAKTVQRRSGGKAIAHRDGNVVAAGNAPTAMTYSVRGHALEPTISITPSGDMFYAAAGYDLPRDLPGTQILRSTDGGRTWANTSPRVLGQNTMPLTLDPYVYVDDLDGDNARVFTIDLTVACSYMSFSDDGGETWTTNPLACGRPVNDHQTLFSGPPASSPTVGYPNVLYYCWNDVGSSSCGKSLDGGITFHPTGTPAFEGYEPGNADPGFGADGFCGGLHGHGHVARDGTVYLPREFCGKPMLAISHDEGVTWDRVAVSKIRSISQPKEGAAHPSVVTDKKGNVYYTWIGAKTRLLYLSVSRDQGKTWSRAVVAGPPHLTESNLPQIDAKGVGKIAIAYYGSTNSPWARCHAKCEQKDYLETTWNGYLTISANALDKQPLFYSGLVNDPSEPLVRKECGPGRCWRVMDFIDVEIGPDGIAYGAFVDSCMPPACTAKIPNNSSGADKSYEGLMTKLVGGPRLN